MFYTRLTFLYSSTRILSMDISLTELLLLGILAEKPQHGYHIEHLIEEQGMRKWTEVGFSSIYYVLARLEKKGLAAGAHTAGKAQKRYSITDKGMAILKEETKNRIEKRRPSNMHFMTGLAGSWLLESSELIDAFKNRRNEIKKDLQALQKKITENKDAPRSARELLSLSEALLKTEADWISAELRRIKK